MSIANQLLILSQTKNNIKESINLKGVEVTDEAFAEYPDKIRQIPNGGGWYESNVILFLEGKLKNLVVPSGTTTIRDFAYSGNSLMETLTIPSSVQSIGKNAFCCNWRLSSVTIDNGVTTIGERAFSVCERLNSIVFPDSVTTIGDDCLYMSSVSYVEFGTGIRTLGKRIITIYNAVLNFRSTTPPTKDSSSFPSSSELTIYVPDSSVLDYQVAWTEYANNIKPVSQMPS